MIPFLFVLFALLGLADSPGCETTLPEQSARQFEHLLERLDTIAAHVRPPPPVPLMAAAVLFVFFTSVPARLAAAWGRLVGCANNAAPDGCWAIMAILKLVLCVDYLLSPFKLEDWETRARATKSALEETRFALAQTAADLRDTKAELAGAKVALNKKQADLDEYEVGFGKMSADLDKFFSKKRRFS